MNEEQPPVYIIVKKSKGHGGHHGGAWKVAYADFVTAMMALFIVLWLLSSDEKVKKAVGGYFQDPAGVGKQVGSNMGGNGETFTLKKDDMEKLKETLQAAIQQSPDFKKFQKNIQMIITGEGLRIELIEDEGGVFFDSGSAAPSTKGEQLIATLGKELAKLPNRVYLEGHTDSKPFSTDSNYTNWELSADRANAARRIIQANGVRRDQIGQVRGFADQNLRLANAPEDPSNRRISMIVQYTRGQTKEEAERPEGKQTGKEEKESTHGRNAAGH